MIAVLIDVPNMKGVAYHRLYVPFKHLQKKGHNVKFFANLDKMTDADLKECRAIVTSRGFAPKHGYAKIREALHAFGIQIVLDQDDYWALDNWHPMKAVFDSQNKKQQIYDSIWASDWITVTHEKLKKEVARLDKAKRVAIFPNAIDNTEGQWNVPKIESDELRFGYIAGASHERDLDVLGGFNFALEGLKMTVADVMSYKDILGASTVLPTEDVYNYGKLYSHIDVSIAPLKPSKFNKMKSDLKVLEAGFTKTAFIGSNIHPYTNLIENGVNGILCNNAKEWREAFEGMTKEKAKEMGERLYDTVQEFSIESVNRLREKFFFS